MFTIKNILILTILLFSQIYILPQPKTSEISSLPGSFSRMGFGARGISMGNAMSSIIQGNLNSYYNPALSAFQNDNNVNLGYSFLTLDRSLNFLNFSRNFIFYKKDENGNKTDQISSVSGISLGIINSGVSKIDGRDGAGYHTKDYKTSENQFFINFSIKPSTKLAFGISLKLYYYSLFEDMSSTSFALDIGGIYTISDELTLSVSLIDLNAKYKWNSTEIYGQEGKSNLEDKFPLLKKLGVSYILPEYFGILAFEYESSNAGTNILKIGAEINIIQFLKLRAGLDRLNLSNKDMIPKYSIGFGILQNILNKNLELDYAFQREPYAPGDIHVLTLKFIF